ncbi:hypothetical protein PAPYR_2917 [Paratrimastix pyriformis]|uniref:F-box domain-containing protein n=1 Tax=Paratrimastix pyriformis TaxID=342808 RepID=A0ABQ8UND6_9EUKA|nr:hypothetical protein PAPYR_2917 [Paratrimastix pyriformis]
MEPQFNSLFGPLPQDILLLIVENCESPDSLGTYLSLIGTNHHIRAMLRGTLRSISFSDPVKEEEYELGIRMGWNLGKTFSIPAEKMALLLGPCKYLQDLTLGVPIAQCGREEAKYCPWVDAAFNDHPNIRTLRLTNEFCRSLSLGALDRIFSHMPHLEELRVRTSAHTRRWGEALFETLAHYCPRLRTLAYQNPVIGSNPCALQACRELRSLSLEYPDPSREKRMGLGRDGWLSRDLPSDPQLEGVLSQLPRLETLSTPDLGVVHAHPDLVIRIDVPAWLQRRSLDKSYPAYPRLAKLRMQYFGTSCLPLVVGVAPHLRVFRANLQPRLDLDGLLAALRSAPHLAEVLLQSYPSVSFRGLPELWARLERFTMDSQNDMQAPGSALVVRSERLAALTLSVRADLTQITVECPSLVHLLLPSTPSGTRVEMRCPRLRRLHPHPTQRLVALCPMTALQTLGLRYHQEGPIAWMDDLGAFPGVEQLTCATLKGPRWTQWLAATPVARLGATLNAHKAFMPDRCSVALSPALRELYLTLDSPPAVQLSVCSPTLTTLCLYASEVKLALRCPALRSLGTDAQSVVIEGPSVPPLEWLRWRGQTSSRKAVNELEQLLAQVGPTLTFLIDPDCRVEWVRLRPRVEALPRLEALEITVPKGPAFSFSSATLRRLAVWGHQCARIEVHCPTLEVLVLYDATEETELLIDEAPYLFRLEGNRAAFRQIEAAFPGVVVPQDESDDESDGSGDTSDEVFNGDPFD